ncbi:tryptophan-rich sensory protein [Legionella busanensis]|uniref:Tryptophan-rich sensory protein n=1 Tax=Legionella busanensis TaxID=190655 RepID=A0A378JMB9_9GAMM|nr:TspO/MBR family protein [Legionella busanensis]STX52375.1 tryptophan-rich sensory protein [Legionella busanensis]
MLKKDFWKIGLWILIYEGIGFLLGQLTKVNIQPWYNKLIKSNLTPPAITFSIVWSLLYAILAIVGWTIWQNKKTNPGSEQRIMWYLYVVQMIMNWLWTPIFFHYHLLGFSLVWITALTILNLVLGYKLINKNSFIGVLFTPYILWLFFATYLNAVIYWWN